MTQCVGIIREMFTDWNLMTRVASTLGWQTTTAKT